MAVVTGMETVAGAPPLDMGLRIRLSVMMFLQFAVWGAWFTLMGPFLGKAGFAGDQIGIAYSTMALGAIVSMMIAGQLADRLFNSEHIMGVCHLLGAGLLYAMSVSVDKDNPWKFHAVAFAYALLFNPTLAVANSLAFRNIPDATRDFPTLRVLGTIGWIAAGMGVGAALGDRATGTTDSLVVAACASFALSVFSFVALPHTPPNASAETGVPFLRALALLKDPGFAVFFGVSFAIAIALAFYYGFAGVYLGDRGIGNIAGFMTIGQWSEIGFMLLLPLSLARFGMKAVLLVGMGAWVLRYGIFAVSGADMMWALVIGVALHGICFDYLIAAGFIHTDNKAPAEIRGSAQALYSFLLYGAGMYIGNLVSGFASAGCTVWKGDYTPPAGVGPKLAEVTILAEYPDFTVRQTYELLGGTGGTFLKSVVVTDWQTFWMGPAIGAAACLLVFALLWKDTPGKLGDSDGKGKPDSGKPEADPLAKPGA